MRNWNVNLLEVDYNKALSSLIYGTLIPVRFGAVQMGRIDILASDEGNWMSVVPGQNLLGQRTAAGRRPLSRGKIFWTTSFLGRTIFVVTFSPLYFRTYDITGKKLRGGQ